MVKDVISKQMLKTFYLHFLLSTTFLHLHPKIDLLKGSRRMPSEHFSIEYDNQWFAQCLIDGAKIRFIRKKIIIPSGYSIWIFQTSSCGNEFISAITDQKKKTWILCEKKISKFVWQKIDRKIHQNEFFCQEILSRSDFSFFSLDK